MIKHTPKSRGQFESIKSSIMSSIFKISEREYEAMNSGNEQLKNQLFEKRIELQMEILSIREAEIAYLNSDLAIEEAKARLIKATQEIKNTLSGLQKINTALQSASQIFTLLTRLANLFN